MWEFFEKGGPAMWPLLVLSIIALAVVVERLLVLLSARTDVDAFMSRVENALAADRYDEAVKVAKEGGGVMGRKGTGLMSEGHTPSPNAVAGLSRVQSVVSWSAPES